MSGEEFTTRVAVRTGLAVPAVERIFREHGFAPALAGTLPRPIQLIRLRVAGTRSVQPLGPFDREFRFGPGLTVLAADNLRGKTSVFELITWCLRGSPRANLQGVVRGWVSQLDCDAVVAGRPLGFRLTVKDGDLVEGRVLTGPDPARLAVAGTAEPGSAIVPVIHATSQAVFADRVEKLMMELLHLEELESRSGKATTGKATYGWPSYYGALYLPPGGDPALLGDTVMGGLAGRLLQVFLDLPGAALLTRLKTARDQLEDAARAADKDATRVRTVLESRRADVLRRLNSARTEKDARPDPPRTATLLAEVSERTDRAVTAEAGLREARETFALLREQRQRDEKNLNDLLEDRGAGLFFHALDPKACPRCEKPIGAERRAAERTRSICAVCAEPVVPGDGGDAGDQAEQEARWRLAAGRAAEELAARHRAEAIAYAADQRSALADAERALDAVRSGEPERRRRELQQLIDHLEGAATAWESLPTAAGHRRDDVRVVLDAAVDLLSADQNAAGEDVFAELDADIAELARGFGFRNLDRVAVDRQGKLQVFKTGGPQEWFTNQSPGERLRLRIAVVVALLRRGHRHGIATHPGLLLIDSPRSEEVQDDDAAALLTALEQLCAETPGLQILVTTADEHLVRRNLHHSEIIAAPGPGQPLW